MKINEKNPPRKFTASVKDSSLIVSDCGDLVLEANEQITVKLANGKGYDVAAKSWGFYGTPSVNARLKSNGFKTALVKNGLNRYFIMLVDIEKQEDFSKYLKSEENEVIQWLDEL